MTLELVRNLYSMQIEGEVVERRFAAMIEIIIDLWIYAWSVTGPAIQGMIPP